MPGEEISVYDPTTDKRFVLKDGELVEPSEKDVETGNTPFSLCGCCSGTVDVEEQNSGDIALTVEKQEAEVHLITGDVIIDKY